MELIFEKIINIYFNITIFNENSIIKSIEFKNLIKFFENLNNINNSIKKSKINEKYSFRTISYNKFKKMNKCNDFNYEYNKNDTNNNAIINAENYFNYLKEPSLDFNIN